MEDLHLVGAALENDEEILVELSDGRSLTFSLAKLLTLVPDTVATLEGAEEDDT